MQLVLTLLICSSDQLSFLQHLNLRILNGTHLLKELTRHQFVDGEEERRRLIYRSNNEVENRRKGIRRLETDICSNKS